jgi:hypothetical protein
MLSVSGGDTTQLPKTKGYLEEAGVRVDISMELTPDLTGYDSYTCSTLIRPQEVLTQARNARCEGKTVAFQPSMSIFRVRGEGKEWNTEIVARSLSSRRLEYLNS